MKHPGCAAALCAVARGNVCAVAACDDRVVLPFMRDEEAERMVGDEGGLRNVRSYLRVVRDPSLSCP